MLWFDCVSFRSLLGNCGAGALACAPRGREDRGSVPVKRRRRHASNRVADLDYLYHLANGRFDRATDEDEDRDALLIDVIRKLEAVSPERDRT